MEKSGMRRFRIGVLVWLTGLAATCPAQTNGGQAMQDLAFLGLQGELPAAWESMPPETSMRLAQYRLPGPPEAELVVFFFGANTGGSVELNAARWSSQFTDESGRQVQPQIEVLRESGPRVTLVTLQGNYARAIGMKTDAERRPDHMLLAAVVESGQGNAYIQLWGPRSTVASAREAYLRFLRGLAVAG